MTADWIRETLSLVRRDYAVQFAGTMFGLVWLFAQYGFQIAVFFVVFGFLLPDRPGTAGGNFLAYLFGGMTLWLPLSEMLLRSCSILSDNAALIRRTNVGPARFVWVPVAQSFFHYFLIFIPAVIYAAFHGTLTMLFPLGFLFGLLTLFFFSGWAFVFARIGVILKDISPVLRLVMQLIFWCTPIVYRAEGAWKKYFILNPFYSIFELHRSLTFSSGSLSPDVWIGLSWFVPLSLLAFMLSHLRLKAIAVDHL